MNPKFRFISVAILFLMVAILLFKGPLSYAPNPVDVAEKMNPQARPIMTEAAAKHILYGDGFSGGHLHGIGTPCKSEFPVSWDADKIIGTVTSLADNDNAKWRQEENGYFVSEQKVDDLDIRIVLNSHATEIITSYPLNVTRNPCPTPANDNNLPD